MSQILNVKIEQLKVVSPFLKFSAKILNNPKAEALKELKKYFNEAPNVGVRVGGMCIAAVGPRKFERCRLMHVNGADKMATVWFIDCNYQGAIPCSQVRIRDSKGATYLISHFSCESSTTRIFRTSIHCAMISFSPKSKWTRTAHTKRRF